jgi:hypothetical protein
MIRSSCLTDDRHNDVAEIPVIRYNDAERIGIQTLFCHSTVGNAPSGPLLARFRLQDTSWHPPGKVVNLSRYGLTKNLPL